MSCGWLWPHSFINLRVQIFLNVSTSKMQTRCSLTPKSFRTFNGLQEGKQLRPGTKYFLWEDGSGENQLCLKPTVDPRQHWEAQSIRASRTCQPPEITTTARLVFHFVITLSSIKLMEKKALCKEILGIQKPKLHLVNKTKKHEKHKNKTKLA